MEEVTKEWLEREKENFKNHVATFTDYGNIKILDFKNPASCHYRIRFMFEEDYCRLHISGDLGHLVATNYNNMVYEKFYEHYVPDVGYFKSKVDCCDRPFVYYDDEQARKDLKERLDEMEIEFEYSWQMEEILEDLNEDTGFGSKAYDILRDYDPDCHEYISDIGKQSTGILHVYLMAFKLAYEQLEKKEENK